MSDLSSFYGKLPGIPYPQENSFAIESMIWIQYVLTAMVPKNPLSTYFLNAPLPTSYGDTYPTPLTLATSLQDRLLNGFS